MLIRVLNINKKANIRSSRTASHLTLKGHGDLVGELYGIHIFARSLLPP